MNSYIISVAEENSQTSQFRVVACNELNALKKAVIRFYAEKDPDQDMSWLDTMPADQTAFIIEMFNEGLLLSQPYKLSLSDVINETDTGLYEHIKTGNEYSAVLTDVKMKMGENWHDAILYTSSGSDIYCRQKSHFDEKFKPVK